MEKFNKNKLFVSLGNFVSVENAPSRNGYSKAPNQFIIRFTNGSLLQSYDSIVAGKLGNTRFVTKKHDYSATTNRFVSQYLGGMRLDERRRAIKNGELQCIELTD